LIEEPVSVVEQQHPRLGELHPALQTAKEGRPYLLLKLADLQTEGRLLDAEPFRRASKMQLFGDRDEIAEMPKFHVPTTPFDWLGVACCPAKPPSPQGGRKDNRRYRKYIKDAQARY
jgi:hypothetical protein